MLQKYGAKTTRKYWVIPNNQCNGRTEIQTNYYKVTTTSSSHLEAHAGFFRLPMKGKFDVYLLGNFGKKVNFHIIKTC